MATIHKLTKDGATIFPATITDAVVHPNTGKTLTSMIKDYNVSELFPSEGIDGGNKYNLSLAISVLASHLTAAERTGGIKLSFISSVTGYPEEEYFLLKNQWSTNVSDWGQRFEVGGVIANPSGSWTPGTAEEYIDQQVAELNTTLTGEMSARATVDSNLQTQINSEVYNRNAIDSQQDTRLGELETAYRNLTESDVIVGPRPSSGQQTNVIYREPDQGHTPPQFYSDYMWYNNGWVQMAQYDNGIDDNPLRNSNNLVKSSGVFNNMGAFDISAYTGNTYSGLSAALAVVPSNMQAGGMSVKFIQEYPAQYSVVKTTGLTTQPTGTALSTDPNIVSGTYTAAQLNNLNTASALPSTLNSSKTYYLTVSGTTTTYTTWVVTYVQTSSQKYVQYRLMSQNWSTTESNWQGVDATPTEGSKNILESGGMYNVLYGGYEYTPMSLTLNENHYYGITVGGTKIASTPASRNGTSCCFLESQPGKKYKVFGKGSINIHLYAFTDDTNLILDSNSERVDYRESGFVITAPSGTTKLFINFLDYSSSTDKLENGVATTEGIVPMIEELDENKFDKSDVINDLTTGGINKALSAEQGKVLNNKVNDIVDTIEPYKPYGTPLSFTLTGSHSGFLAYYFETNRKYLVTINCVGTEVELAKLRYFQFWDTNDVTTGTIIYQEEINNLTSGVDHTFELVVGNTAVNYVRVARLSTHAADINVSISAISRQNTYLSRDDFEELSDENRENAMGLPLNVFGDILPQQFKQKLYSTEDDILIAVQGDSIVGKIDTCNPSPDPTHDAPGAQYQSFVSMIQKMVGKVKPFYNRLDSVRNNTDFFTKTGTWEQATDTTFGPNGNPAINDSFKDSSVSCLTYRSNSSNAAVSFAFDADTYDKCNIVFTRNLEAATAVLTIQEGNGKMLVSIDRVTWVEANGFSHSQDSQTPTETTTENGVAKCERHRRLWMKKANGVTGTIHIAYLKTGNDSKYMYCWGTEMYFGRGIFFDNIGRGGRTILRLSQNISDIFDRNPDLAILELPFINDAYHFSTYTDWKAELDGYFTDNIKDRSYRVRSENYTKVPIVVVLAHTRAIAFDENDCAVAMPAETQFIRTSPAYDIWKYLFGYLKIQLASYDNVVFVDMLDQFINETAFRYGSIYEGLQANKMTADGTHLNQRSSNVYAKYLAPVFYI